VKEFRLSIKATKTQWNHDRHVIIAMHKSLEEFNKRREDVVAFVRIGPCISWEQMRNQKVSHDIVDAWLQSYMISGHALPSPKWREFFKVDDTFKL
jgi:hypothetical protein